MYELTISDVRKVMLQYVQENDCCMVSEAMLYGISDENLAKSSFKDLGFDSMDTADIILRIELEYDLNVYDDDYFQRLISAQSIKEFLRILKLL